MKEKQTRYIYLDYNSTSPLAPGVKEAVLPYLGPEFGNPSSKQNTLGRNAALAIEQARESLANLLNCKTRELIFTSGGTESCFMALVGSALAQREKKHIIISEVEHPAVSRAADFLKETLGVEISYLPVDSNGQIELETLKKSIRTDTLLISVILANNETGVLSPLAEICALAREAGIAVHSDAVQAVGKIPLDFSELGLNLLSLSGHKFGAMKGVGALVVKEGSSWSPVIQGGMQESGRRGGTENVPGIVSLGQAATQASESLRLRLDAQLAQIRNYFEELALERIPDSRVHAQKTARIPNTSSICFAGVINQELLELLAERQILVSAGSACKSSSFQPSAVLKAMGLGVTDCLSTLRFSFGHDSSREMVQHVIEVLAQAVAYLRAEARESMQTKLRGNL